MLQGAIFIPSIDEDEARAFIEDMTEQLSHQDRLLPGDMCIYLTYLVDQMF